MYMQTTLNGTMVDLDNIYVKVHIMCLQITIRSTVKDLYMNKHCFKYMYVRCVHRYRHMHP